MKDPNDCESKLIFIDLSTDGRIRLWEEDGANLDVPFERFSDFIESRQDVLSDFLSEELEGRKPVDSLSKKTCDELFETIANITKAYNHVYGAK